MSSKLKSFSRYAWILAAALVLPGLLAHYVMAGGPRPPASEFGLGPRRSAAGRYTATLQPAQPISGRGMQRIALRLSDSAGAAVGGASIAVSGAMPEHGHGMPTQPRVTRDLGDGLYQVDGVRFSMPGWWTLTFVVDGTSGRDSVTFNLKL